MAHSKTQFWSCVQIETLSMGYRSSQEFLFHETAHFFRPMAHRGISVTREKHEIWKIVFLILGRSEE